MVYPLILCNAERDDLLGEQNPWAVGFRFSWHGEKGGSKIHILILNGSKGKLLQSVFRIVQESCLFCCSQIRGIGFLPFMDKCAVHHPEPHYRSWVAL